MDEIETGTGTETGKGRGKEKENRKEGSAHLWPKLWPFHQVPFSRTSVNAIPIVWKARCTIVTAIANVTVEGLVHIILHFLPLRPSLRRQYVNHVRAYL